MIMKGQETYSFQSEVKQLLHLMIHSLYSNKEIFLRELISNASDAADKLRFHALSDPNLYENDNELYVRIATNKDKRTITICDNCIGLTREEVINNIGTIAKSGSKEFLKSISLEHSKNRQIIGQFGVGFYSAFIVADKVSLRTRSAGLPKDKGVFWESNGEGEYSIANIEKIDKGTEIILHLRKGEDDFLEEWNLRRIISKYSDHIELPIELQIEDKKNNTITWEKVNKAQALWTRKKSEITETEYIEFYKHISNDFQDPIIWSHNYVEGTQEYISLLYVPSHAPFDMWNRESQQGIKLYVQRIFITDDAKQFMPNYLRFIKGLIDSNDLPLNISREMLQDNHITKNLRNALTKRVIQMLEKLSIDNNEKYQTFWKEFGLVLKEGPAEDNVNQQTIIKLLRFSSTINTNSEQTVSLADYVTRMKDDQNHIYYITADSYAAAKNSPHLELFNQKNIEVLLLFDRIDEWMMSYITEFNGKTFQLISKTNDSLNKLVDKKIEDQKKAEEIFKPFIMRVKNLLENKVKEVRLTHRLTDTPAIVTTDSNEMTTQMAKLFAAAGKELPEVKYIFEINPEHPIIKNIINMENENSFKKWIELLLDEALLIECGSLEDPNKFIHTINQLLIN
ncbi:MAG: molecular chaperone HtpG [Pantoea sp. Brub]|nr:molecular chaperone HtpG [Pantoea sp. Brub]